MPSKNSLTREAILHGFNTKYTPFLSNMAELYAKAAHDAVSTLKSMEGLQFQFGQLVKTISYHLSKRFVRYGTVLNHSSLIKEGENLFSFTPFADKPFYIIYFPDINDVGVIYEPYEYYGYSIEPVYASEELPSGVNGEFPVITYMFNSNGVPPTELFRLYYDSYRLTD